jgi:CoA:oxalate CoA-transferase
MTGVPLTGLVVVDFSELLPGPFFTQNLVELGARVVKVERPGGDNARALGPGLFAAVNHGKEYVTANLRDPADRDRVERLVARADVLVEGFRPGTMARLELGPGRVLADHPALVYVSLSGFGQDDDLVAEPGHDNTYAAYAGLLALAGAPDEPPSWGPGVPVADLCAAMYATAATLAALHERARTGRGGHVDVSIRDCLAHWLNPRLGTFAHAGLTTVAQQRRSALVRPGYGTFTGADGAPVAIAAIEDHFWAALVDALGLADWTGPEYARHSDRRPVAGPINAAIAEAVLAAPAATTVALLRERGVPVAPVLDPHAALAAAAEHRVVDRPGVGRVYRWPVRTHPSRTLES